MNNLSNNEVFWKGITRLSHPFTLFALFTLFINDWVLRVYRPSRWTGKLGDFAWLFFFPLLLATLLSIFIPDRVSQRGRLVIAAAVFITGLIFSLANVNPSFNNLVNRALQAALRVPGDITRDPTDLIALGSLAAAWIFWEVDLKITVPRITMGWVAIQVGLLLTIANMPAQDYGIDSLSWKGDRIIAHWQYVSKDGGLTWEEVEPAARVEKEKLPKRLDEIRYTYTPGEVIKVSTDGGKTYPFDYPLRPVSQPLRIKYEMRDGIPVFKQGPLDAGIDPVSGNVLFAMGHEGVLVFTPDHEWEWVPVGPYRRLTYDPGKEFLSLLVGEILMCIGFGLLVINTLILTIYRGWFRKVIVSIGWVGLFFTGALNPPALSFGQPSFYLLGQLFQYIAILFGILVFLILGILALIKIYPHSRTVVHKLLLIGLSGSTIFLAPYLLWGFSILPEYSTAAVIAFLTGGMMLASLFHILMDDLTAFGEKISNP